MSVICISWSRGFAQYLKLNSALLFQEYFVGDILNGLFILAENKVGFDRLLGRSVYEV